MALTTPAVPASGVAQLNTSGQNGAVAVTGGTVQAIGLAPVAPFSFATPAVPASGTSSTNQVTNSNPFPVLVALTGFTSTFVFVNGVQVGTTANPLSVVVPAGGNISITYSVVGTWTWTGLLYGVSGNPLASPSSVPLPSLSTIILAYTAAPTWAWTDPLDLGYTPGYAGENTVLISEISQLPWTAHSVGGETGLGVAVDN